MVALNRVRVGWTNWPGAPGVSTFYLASSTTNVTPLRTFFTAIKDLMPAGLTTDVPNSGDVIDTATGHITGGWVGSGGGTSVSGTASQAYSGASGALVRWQTDGILNGRRLVGRTYFVPMAQGVYANDGSLSGTTQTTLGTAATALITALAGALIIYGPPRDTGTNGPTDPGKAAQWGSITAATVPDLAAVMRSRRT